MQKNFIKLPKIFKLSNLLMLDFKKKSTIIFIIIIIFSLLYNFFSSPSNTQNKNQIIASDTSMYSKSKINLIQSNIDENYERPQNKIDYSSIFSIIVSYKNKKNTTQYNLLDKINKNQAILIRNFIDIDIYNFLINQNPNPSLDYSNLIRTENINPNNLKYFQTQTNKYYIINQNLENELCNENYCTFNSNGNNFYNFKILVDDKNSIENFNKFKDYSQIFLCKTIASDQTMANQLNFSDCIYQKNYINEYANNLSIILEKYPDYLTESAKHLIYSALIAYFYIDINSVCYNDNLELYDDKNICINQINSSMKSARNLNTSFSNFAIFSRNYQKILKISIKNNKEYIDYQLEEDILNNILNQLPRTLTASERLELTIQLNKLYKPGDNFEDSKANNINNYDLSKIYQK